MLANFIALIIIVFGVYIFLVLFGMVFGPKAGDLEGDDMTEHFFYMEEFFDPRLKDHDYENDSYHEGR